MTADDCLPPQVKKPTTCLIRVFLRAELQITRPCCQKAGSKWEEEEKGKGVGWVGVGWVSGWEADCSVSFCVSALGRGSLCELFIFVRQSSVSIWND